MWRKTKIRLDGKQFKFRFNNHQLELCEESTDKRLLLPIIDLLKEFPQDTATAIAVVDNALTYQDVRLLEFLHPQ